MRWEDSRVAAWVVRLRGPLQSRARKLVYVPTTKTNQDRELPLHPEMVDRLRALRVDQDLKDMLDPDGIVFLNPDGRRLHEKYVYNYLRAACAAAEVPPVSPHKLRHTVATITMMETGDIHAVQKLLGHQQSRLTADLYAHGGAERLRPTSDALARIFKQNVEGPDEPAST